MKDPFALILNGLDKKTFAQIKASIIREKSKRLMKTMKTQRPPTK